MENNNHDALPLGIESEFMLTLRTQVDQLLRKTLMRMQNTHCSTAKMGIALEIELVEAAVPDGTGSYRSAVVPKIKHKVKTQIQITGEEKGSTPSDHELLFDPIRSEYYLRIIPRNQTSLFDDDDSTASGLLEDDDLAFDDADDTPLPFEDDETA